MTLLGALGNVEYPFIAITPRSTLTWSASTFLGSDLWVKGNCWSSFISKTNDDIKLKSSIEQVLETAPHKAAAIRQPTTHHENYQN